MKARDCVRLLIVGIWTGLLPACLYGPRPAAQPAAAPFADNAPRRPLIQNPVWLSTPANSSAAIAHKPVFPNSSLQDQAPLPMKLVSREPQLPPDHEPPMSLVIPMAPDAPPAGDMPGIQIDPQSAFQPRALPASLTDESPLVQALRHFIDKRPDAAIESIKPFDPENQDILLHLLPLTVRMSEGPLSQADPQEIAALIDQMYGLIQYMQPRAAWSWTKCASVAKCGGLANTNRSATNRNSIVGN